MCSRLSGVFAFMCMVTLHVLLKTEAWPVPCSGSGSVGRHRRAAKKQSEVHNGWWNVTFIRKSVWKIRSISLRSVYNLYDEERILQMAWQIFTVYVVTRNFPEKPTAYKQFCVTGQAIKPRLTQNHAYVPTSVKKTKNVKLNMKTRLSMQNWCCPL